MSIIITEYRAAVDSLTEALRLLDRMNPEAPTRDDQQRVRNITSQALQGAKSCAILQGLIEFKFGEKQS